MCLFKKAFDLLDVSRGLILTAYLFTKNSLVVISYPLFSRLLKSTFEGSMLSFSIDLTSDDSKLNCLTHSLQILVLNSFSPRVLRMLLSNSKI